MGSLHSDREEKKLATLSATSPKLVDELGEEKEESSRTCLSVTVPAEEANPALPVAVTETATETMERDTCRTPTAQENRIPEYLTCPPPPKKQREIMPTTVPVRAREFFCPLADLDAIFPLRSSPMSQFRL